MRRYHSWLTALGLAAATPGLTFAGPFSALKGESAAPAAASNTQEANQRTAIEVAKALRAAQLSGYNIQVEYKGGVATLIGAVPTADKKALASQMCYKVPGVKSVDNRLAVSTQGEGAVQKRSERPAALPASPEVAANSQVNQVMANRIAGALQQSEFEGSNVGVEFQDGVAKISGVVDSQQQKAMASGIITRVPGVQRIDNRLTVAGQGRREIQQVQYAAPPQYAAPQAGMMGPPGAMMGPQGGMMGAPAGMMPPQGAYPASAAMAQAGGPMPMYGQGGNVNPVIYDQPNMPSYAWPSYAAYPNYAAVTYPKQYSASAWPYIGPFYPYPQVPLGWRKVQLEWDDGYWQLNFHPRTDRWWWFMNPKNW